MTGPIRLAWSAAPLAEIAPAATRAPAAGTAMTASGQPRGLITAHASTATSASTETVSPAAAFSVILPRHRGDYSATAGSLPAVARPMTCLRNSSAAGSSRRSADQDRQISRVAPSSMISA
jgi:hypothetical protein